MLNLNFLRALVVILGIAIFSLIILIIFKIMNGDLSSKKDNYNEIEKNNSLNLINKYKLSLKRNDNIKSIFSAGKNIVIHIENVQGNSLLILDEEQKIRLIILNEEDDYSFNEDFN
tara:strand:- start:962 stop:1309 length:348 start_codon:yes stop_codon:yes gene_type:complete